MKDDIRAALARNDREHARKLFMALRDFLSMHPKGAAPFTIRRHDVRGT